MSPTSMFHMKHPQSALTRAHRQHLSRALSTPPPNNNAHTISGTPYLVRITGIMTNAHMRMCRYIKGFVLCSQHQGGVRVLFATLGHTTRPSPPSPGPRDGLTGPGRHQMYYKKNSFGIPKKEEHELMYTDKAHNMG